MKANNQPYQGRRLLLMSDGSEIQFQPVRADDVTPDHALALGYDLYIMADENSPHSEAARLSVERFTTMIASFPADSRESLYLSALMSAALSMGRGIGRRKNKLHEREEAIKREQEEIIRNMSKAAKWTYMMRFAYRMVLMGGFGYALVRALFFLPTVQQHAADVNEGFASICFAIVVALFWGYISEWMSHIKLSRIFKHFDRAKREADYQYKLSVMEEYQLAAQSARKAWIEFTGREPPMSEAFDRLIRGVIGLREDDDEFVVKRHPSLRDVFKMFVQCMRSSTVGSK
jgi:hypothetical protein